MGDHLKLNFEQNLQQEISELPVYEFQEGDEIITYGKQLKMMPLVLKGNIKVLKRDDDGKEILLYYLSANDSCSMAYSCCMESKLSEIKAIAEDEVTLIAIPHSKLDEWLCKYPSWKAYIMQSFNARFLELLKTVESIAFKKLDERLINYLNEKRKITGSAVIKVSHYQIADELATSRVVISRLLKQLENDKKVILYRNELKLMNNF
jgi:CRP/FNR family transcriptional regulator